VNSFDPSGLAACIADGRGNCPEITLVAFKTNNDVGSFSFRVEALEVWRVMPPRQIGGLLKVEVTCPWQPPIKLNAGASGDEAALTQRIAIDVPTFADGWVEVFAQLVRAGRELAYRNLRIFAVKDPLGGGIVIQL
jgi:hypothetical protein